jgi:hypothetical protein
VVIAHLQLWPSQPSPSGHVLRPRTPSSSWSTLWTKGLSLATSEIDCTIDLPCVGAPTQQERHLALVTLPTTDEASVADEGQPWNCTVTFSRLRPASSRVGKCFPGAVGEETWIEPLPAPSRYV